jgi:hypothetical protein
VFQKQKPCNETGLRTPARRRAGTAGYPRSYSFGTDEQPLNEQGSCSALAPASSRTRRKAPQMELPHMARVATGAWTEAALQRQNPRMTPRWLTGTCCCRYTDQKRAHGDWSWDGVALRTRSRKQAIDRDTARSSRTLPCLTGWRSKKLLGTLQSKLLRGSAGPPECHYRLPRYYHAPREQPACGSGAEVFSGLLLCGPSQWIR